MLERNKIYQGDSVEILKTFPDECISMCVTSPPYYKLREYFVDNQIGQESTPELYVEHLVEVFREVRRVLRHDGQFWLNLGDSHAGSGIHAAHHKNPGISNAAHRGGAVATPIPQGMKPTDLMEIPSMVAIALRNDGWYLRCRLSWVKRNSMPDSAKIRMGHAVEYVFQFAKSGKSYFDHEPIRVAHTKANQEDYDARVRRGRLGWGDQSTAKHSVDAESGIQHYAKSKKGRSRDEFHHPGGRQRRDSDSFFESWQGLYEEDGDLLGLIVNPKGNKYQHFATFPEKLIEPLIKCSTSAFGYCRECGAPFKRVIKKDKPDEEWKAKCGADSKGGYKGTSEKWLKQDELGKNTYTGFNARWKKTQQNASDVKRRVLEGMVGNTTLGWEPTCDCKIIDDPIKYSHKQTGVDIGQAPSSFVREAKIEKERELHKKQAKEMYPDDEKAQKAYIKYMHDHGQITESTTIGWAPSCSCIEIETQPADQKQLLELYAQYKPARGIVLDPFIGSGTSAVVAKRLGLDYIGIDLNPTYIKDAEKRISESDNLKPEKKSRKSNKKQVTLDAGT